MSAWLLSDGKVGDEIPCLGLARAMGLVPVRRLVRPHPLFAALAPWGPPDPRDVALSPPYPAIAFASGRRTVPYLRKLKQRSPNTFTIFLKDPRIGTRAADAIWVPQHDPLRGRNVIASVLAPHTLSSDTLADARERPDSRVACLPSPRAAFLIGGHSRHHRFGAQDVAALIAAMRSARSTGFSVMATASRRTPASLIAALHDSIGSDPGVLIWSGEGANPYSSMLALADQVLVTADSTNMVGEAAASAAPVHVFEPTGGHPKLTMFIDSLVAVGRVRRWSGTWASWPVTPLDATPHLAAEFAARFAAFQQARTR